MKKVFLCEVCGADFESEKECDAHEKKCSKVGALKRKVDALEAKVKELEGKLDILEKYVDIVKSPAYPPLNPMPAPAPLPNNPFPNNPFTPPIVWCTSETTTTYKADTDATKKTDNKPKA